MAGTPPMALSTERLSENGDGGGRRQNGEAGEDAADFRDGEGQEAGRDVGFLLPPSSSSLARRR
jgi:hypothetical protein